METREKVLYHQVRATKLFTDFVTAFASLYLLWRHELVLALVLMWLPSVFVSGLLVGLVTFEDVRDSRVGACLRARMTRAVEALRFGGLGMAASGAWLHEPVLIPLGFALIAGWWGWVVVPRASDAVRARTPGSARRL